MRNPVIEILLGLAVVIGWLSSLGILRMRNPFDRLHYTSPAATLSSLSILAAVLLKEPFSKVGIRLILIFILLLAANSVLAHATAMTARVRDSDKGLNGSKRKRS